jgi:hypothetical protein
MAPATFDFFVLTGDANHDRYVDAADQAIVTADMGKSGMTFAQGDFNGDGKVDAADQAILDAAWHTYLPAPDGDVAVPQGAGDTNYVLKLEVGGGLVDVWNGGSTTAPPLYRIPVTALSSLSLTGGSGNDALTVDLSNGNPLPAGGATFDGGAGANGLRVIGGPGDDAVTLGAASLSIGGRTVRVANTTSFQFPGGSGGSDLIYVSAGTWQVDADTPTGTPNVSLLVSGGATAVSLASGQHLANLAISDGTVTMAAPGAALSVSGSLTINGVGTLDLGSGSLLAPSANVATYVQRAAGAPLPSGMNACTGPGLTNSLVRADAANGNAEALAVGYFDSRDDAQTGLSVPDGYTLVKVTVYGDATGDGVNDTADFTVWRNNFFKGNRWSQGDFNYDGVVDTADFTVWRNHFYDAVGGVSSDAAAQVVPAATVAPVVPMATTKSAPQPAHCRRLAPWRRVARQRRAETLQAEPSAARRHGAG